MPRKKKEDRRVYFVATTKNAGHRGSPSLIGRPVQGHYPGHSREKRLFFFERFASGSLRLKTDVIHISQTVEVSFLAVYPPEHPNKADGMFRWVHHQIKTLQYLGKIARDIEC